MATIVDRDAVEAARRRSKPPGPARFFTEQMFVPKMAAHQPVLSVGICWATEHYQDGVEAFFDVDIAPERHGMCPDIVADITTERFVEACPTKFGFVLAHGVVGHEIQGPGVRVALKNLHRVTKSNAILMCAWSRKRTSWPKMAEAMRGLWLPRPVLGSIPHEWRCWRDMLTVEATRISG